MKVLFSQSGCDRRSLMRLNFVMGVLSSLCLGTVTNFRVVVGGQLRMVVGVSDKAVRMEVSASLVSSLIGFQH